MLKNKMLVDEDDSTGKLQTIQAFLFETSKKYIKPKTLIQSTDTSWNLQQANSFFTGREKELEMLKQALNTGKMAVISQQSDDLNGVGKSTFAKYYAAHSLQHKQYDFVIWITAASPLSAFSDFQQLALALGMSDLETESMESQKLIHWVYEKLSVYTKVLIIFDNAQSQAMLSGSDQPGHSNKINLLPPAHLANTLHWLATASKPTFSESITIIKLSSFSEEEARSYIQKRLSVSDDTADVLAQALSYFPLALCLASAFIIESHCTMEDYLKLFFKLFFEYQEKQSIVLKSPSESAVAITLDISLQRLKKQNPLTELILNSGAYLAETPIPLPLITLMVLSRSGADSLQAIQVLSRYALIDLREDREPNFSAFIIPNLIQSIMRSKMVETKVEPEIAPERHMMLQAFMDAQLMEANIYAARIASSTTNSQQENKATDYFNHICAAWLALFPSSSKNLINKYYSLTRELIAHGESLALHWQDPANAFQRGFKDRYCMPVVLTENVLAMQESYYGPDNIVIAKTLLSLGMAYKYLGKAPKCEELLVRSKNVLERALRIQEKYYSPDHPDMAITLSNLAELREQKDQAVEAIRREEKVQKAPQGAASAAEASSYKTRGSKVPGSKPTLLEQYNQQGIQYFIDQRYAEAITTFENAIQTVAVPAQLNRREEKILAGAHQNLASAYRECKNYEKAVEHFNKSLAGYEKIFGIRSEIYQKAALKKAQCESKLRSLSENKEGVTHFKAGRYREAFHCFASVLKINHGFHQEAHEDIATAAFNAGSCCWKEERYEEAIPYLLQAFDLRKELLGSDHSDTQKAKQRLEECQQKLAEQQSSQFLRLKP